MYILLASIKLPLSTFLGKIYVYFFFWRTLKNFCGDHSLLRSIKMLTRRISQVPFKNKKKLGHTKHNNKTETIFPDAQMLQTYSM